MHCVTCGTPGASAADSYAAYRSGLIAGQFRLVAAIVAATVILYEIAEALLNPSAFWASLPLSALQIAIPTMAWFVATPSFRSVAEPIALTSDLAFTAALTAELFLPGASAISTASFVSLKLLASAMLFTWRPLTQYASTVASLVLLWGAVLLAQPEAEPSIALYLVTTLLIAAVVSTVATARAEHVRRAQFEYSRELTASESRLRTLLDLANEITGVHDLPTLLDLVQRRTAESVAADRVATLYVDEASGLIRLIGTHGIPATMVAEATPLLQLRVDDPLVLRVTTQRSLVLDDVSGAEWIPVERRSLFGAKCAVATQLRTRGKTVGGLIAMRAQAGLPFDAHQVALLEGIAGQLASAIEAQALFQRQQEEGQVDAALARIGRELLSSLDRPILLRRLCDVSTEVLGADFAHVWVHRPDGDVFVAVAASGIPEEQWQALQLLQTPRTAVAQLLVSLGAANDVLVVMTTQLDDPFMQAVARAYRVSHGVYVALRRGDDVVAIVNVGFRRRPPVPLPPHVERIARGIARLGSFALANASLVEELERADRVRAEFMANMSHELRTPLNVIIGYQDLLIEGTMGALAPRQRDTLDRARASARDLLGMVSAALDLSRADAGRLRVVPEAIDVAAFVTELIAGFRTQAEAPSVQLRSDVAPSLSANTDRLKLKMILNNLIGNALKFTDRGEVVVTARKRDGGIEVSILDTGPGIAPDAQALIFEPFQQIGSGDRAPRGVGLGLYLVRRMVTLMGGTIELESDVGRGSTFRVWLPDLFET